MPSKPRLTRCNGYWLCSGEQRQGFGVTPSSAFEQWRVTSPGFGPIRALTLQEQAMLQALRDWVPAQVH